MQRTADFHHTIADACLPQAAGVVDDATALDAAVDVLDTHASTRDAPIHCFLRACEGPASRLPGGHDDFHLIECERQEAQILEQLAARGQGVGRAIRNPLIVHAAGVRVAQKEDRKCRVDQQDVFHRVAFFLAAIIARLLNRVLGAPDAPFGPIVPKRGEAGAGADAAAGGVDVVGGTATAAALASATPRR
jgi:hypothetical protein